MCPAKNGRFLLEDAVIAETEPCGASTDDPCAALAGSPRALPLDTIAGGAVWSTDTSRDIDWFEVTQIRGYIRDGAVDHYQVTLKIGSRLKDA